MRYLLILLVTLSSCCEPVDDSLSVKPHRVKLRYGNLDFYTVIIDGCEYLHSGSGSHRVIVHKGNCQYCK